jgi:threonine/homoserine/homoserine lactone efflux protein
VAPRARILAFGSTAALVVAGGLCLALLGGLTGQVLAIALVTVGLGGALLLVFLEVGLSEDRERAREEERRRRRAVQRAAAHRRPRLPRLPRRRG